MRISLLACSLLLLVSCASTGASTQKEAAGQPGSAAESRAASIAAGQVLFDRCASCHGEDGRGQTPYSADHEVPDFTTQSWRLSRPYDELVESITQGCGPMTAAGESIMPAQEDLSEEEVQTLAVFILSLGDQG